MKENRILDMMELIDSEYIEAADSEPAKVKTTVFAQKPWLKGVAAAAAFVVVIAGTLVAVNVTGKWKNHDFVAPNSGGGNADSGVVTPVDGNEPESSSAPDVEGESSSKGSGSSHGSGQPAGSSAETPEPPASDAPGTDSSEPDSSGSSDVGGGGVGGPLSIDSRFGGTFIKKNMPAVTYRINGEYKSFDYERSSWIIIDAEADLDGNEGVYIIDYYAGKDGSRAVAYDGSEELMEYSARSTGTGDEISEEQAAEAAKQALLNTDVPFSELEDLNTASVVSDKKSFEIVVTFTGGEVELLLDKAGSLKHFIVYKDASVGLSPDRIAAGREKLSAKLEELRAERPNERFVAGGESYQKLANKIYAIYEVTQYPYQGSDFQKRLRFYCVI
ncbi:MAG: hypothetical protein IJU94_03230 [Clostridia bacterium]|nr:hypothetical protein [Clostridia bacterium]